MKNRKLKANKKGQFTILAAILVAIVLIAAVLSTYSAVRYNQITDPQTQSSVDEINMALNKVLGFTVGYYGSILQVTGNTSYAKALAYNYMSSGLENTADIRPEWGSSFNATTFDLGTHWFLNSSYSSGNITVRYDLTGLGVYGITYSTSSRLEVKILQSPYSDQACVSVIKDEDEPLINLGLINFKFYKYDYTNSIWQFVYPDSAPISFANGTYLLDIPSGIDQTAYILSVEDTRGIMVIASSFSQYTSTLAWNSTSVNSGFDYVDNANLNVTGTHSNFTAQQSGPNGVYDTLTEGASGTLPQDYFPTNWNSLGSTNYVNGSITDLQTDNGVYLQLRSYASALSYNTIVYDSQNSYTMTSSASSMSWSHTTGSGNDRILLVSVDVFRSSGSGTPTTVTGVTYGGVALTSVATALYSTDPQVRSYVYMLTNPSSGTQTITVNFASSTSVRAVGGSVTYTNVNQTNPILTFATSVGSGTSQFASVTASGSNSKVLFGHLGTYRTSSYTVTDGQTTIWSQTGQQYKGFGSNKTVTSGSVSTTWTTSYTASWVAIAVLLQPTQVVSAYTCAAEFTSSSNSLNWNSLVWTINAAATISGVSVTYQLYNYAAGRYAVSGEDGYLTDTLGTSDRTQTQTISSSSTNFRDGSGNWKLNVTATKATSTQFDIKFDLIKYTANVNNYALNLQEQWINVTNTRQDLCIKTGSLSSESLLVDVWYGSSWINIMTLSASAWNNVSLSSYITSATLLIRFIDGTSTSDTTQDSWNIDAVFLKNQPDISFLVSLQESTFTVEVMQNGTMNWLGQHLQTSTQFIPIPPIAVKAIHVNATINGVNQEIPFQVEDWASGYRIPLGLSSNSTVFSNRQMIVFLLNNNVTDFTIWWDGSDTAVQTANAYTNVYFTNDNPSGSTLTNGKVSLQFGSFNVQSTVVGTGTYSTATFMRINQEESTYGAGLAYVIHHGIVRDIVQQEAEWSTGAAGSPNLYANIVITLPANVTYYTYQLRIMFINSSQARTLTDLCPIRLTTSLSSVQTQTENSTVVGFPVIQNGTGTYYNFSSGSWTAHHWSQFITNDGTKGAGIMFTDNANKDLYAFDSIGGTTSTGALNVTGTSLIELLPVKLRSVSFTYPLDITWNGAVATFDGTTPVCKLLSGNTPTGLWILAEYPPTLTVTAES